MACLKRSITILSLIVASGRATHLTTDGTCSSASDDSTRIDASSCILLDHSFPGMPLRRVGFTAPMNGTYRFSTCGSYTSFQMDTYIRILSDAEGTPHAVLQYQDDHYFCAGNAGGSVLDATEHYDMSAGEFVWIEAGALGAECSGTAPTCTDCFSGRFWLQVSLDGLPLELDTCPVHMSSSPLSPSQSPTVVPTVSPVEPRVRGPSTCGDVFLFFNSTYVGSGSSSEDEASEMREFLLREGFKVNIFESLASSDGWAPNTPRGVVVIPEQEINTIASDLSTEVIRKIREWVSDGGTYVLTYAGSSRSRVFLSTVFGYSTTRCADTLFSRTDNYSAPQDRFSSGPKSLRAINAHSGLTSSSLPDSASAVYESTSRCAAVAEFNFGSGRIITLGYDFYNPTSQGENAIAWWQALEDSVSECRTCNTAKIWYSSQHVDTGNDDASEASVMYRHLRDEGFLIDSFIDIDSLTGWAPVDSPTVIVPESEVSNTAAELSPGTIEAIQTWVQGGGTYVIGYSGSTNSRNFMNRVFNLSFSSGCALETAWRTQSGILTNFGAGPASISSLSETTGIETAHLPREATSVYESDSGCSAVAIIEFGSGKIITLAYDFFSPIESQDALMGDAWLDVLGIASGQCFLNFRKDSRMAVQPVTATPSASPSISPTPAPTGLPTVSPTESPSSFPTESPTKSPTLFPTESPSVSPTASPSVSPTSLPSASPTIPCSTFYQRFAVTEISNGCADSVPREIQCYDDGMKTSQKSTRKDKKAFENAFSEKWEQMSGLFVDTPFRLEDVTLKISTTGVWVVEEASERNHIIELEYRAGTPISHVAARAAGLQLVGSQTFLNYCGCTSQISITAAASGYNTASSNTKSSNSKCKGEYEVPKMHASSHGSDTVDPNLRINHDTQKSSLSASGKKGKSKMSPKKKSPHQLQKLSAQTSPKKGHSATGSTVIGLSTGLVGLIIVVIRRARTNREYSAIDQSIQDASMPTETSALLR